MIIVEDKDQQLDVDEVLEGFGKEKLDRHKILNKLFNPKLRRYITNIKDDHHIDTLIYMDAHKRAVTWAFEQELQLYTKEEDLTPADLAVKRAFAEINQMTNEIADSYADWRISIKGFRSKQIIDAVAAEYTRMQSIQGAFNKAFTPQEKIK